MSSVRQRRQRADSAADDALIHEQTRQKEFLDPKGHEHFMPIRVKAGGIRSFGTLRRMARRALLPLVANGHETVVAIQQSMRHPVLDAVFMAASMFGTHQFYMLMLPFWFWLGHHYPATHLTMLMCIGIYLGNVFKDLLCLPRPRSPPAVRLLKTGAHEYGMPSTHSVNAVMFPTYLFWHEYHLHPEGGAATWLPYNAALALALSIAFLICFSRLYNGMHCVGDVLAGSALGILILVTYVHYGKDAVDVFIQHAAGVPLIMAVVAVLMVVLHPVPVDPCPCFEDSVCFAGAASGMIIGIAQLGRDSVVPTGPHMDVLFDRERLGWSGGAARVVIGLTLIVVGRAFLKSLCKLVVPPVLSWLDRTAASATTSTTTAKSSKTEDDNEDEEDDDQDDDHDQLQDGGDENGSANHKNKHYHRASGPVFLGALDAETITRLIAYTGVGWIASYAAPGVFFYTGFY